jgi:tRNA(adenine34) deaminase
VTPSDQPRQHRRISLAASRRDGRADKCAALEKPWGSGPRGFESHSLRRVTEHPVLHTDPDQPADQPGQPDEPSGQPDEPSGQPVHGVEAMRVALDEARAAVAHGDVPVGAVALVRDEIVARAHNERERRGDPTAHAELLALRAAAEVLGTWRLDDVTMVVTLEPCPMCAGALVAARVGQLVFGARDPRAGACGSLYNLCSDPRLNHELPVTGGVLADDAAQLLREFFAVRRV